MAEIEYTSLDVTTPSGRSVPNRWLKQTGSANALMLMFPGLNYTCDNPLLYYLAGLAVNRSMDVLQLWANYTIHEFQSLSKADQVRWLLEDARSLIEAGRKNRSYERLIFVGKSIGTLTLAAVFNQLKDLATVPAIWLTPLFRQPVVLESALQVVGNALFIAGSADSTYDAGAMKQVASLPTAQTLVIPGADHSLEIPGDLELSLEILQKIMAAEDAFLSEVI